MIRTSAIVASLMLALGLTGCSLLSGPESANESSATDPAAPEASAVPMDEIEPAAAAVKIPATCDELISPETVETADPRIQSYHPGSQELAETMLGPKTVAALVGGSQTMYCGWGIEGTDALAAVAISVLDDTVRDDLVAALSDSIYSDVTAEYATKGVTADAVFGHGYSSERHNMGVIIVDGPVLIATAHTVEGDFAVYALDSVRQLNAAG
ncbi:hypothetical protein [Lysinibacter cavernae]|uniref:DUF3558 domain-containing protein n=1 Tax=Lysinibacter cavernae TaxID=1640652 RepID=A0A7X5R372_9MICO|nr:hypothetical protein [Lysinibacter cavernae]NIH54687.1 hypothetical protein [Lysinibacter cavernae]